MRVTHTRRYQPTFCISCRAAYHGMHHHDAFDANEVVFEFFSDAAKHGEFAESRFNEILTRRCYSEYFGIDVPCRADSPLHRLSRRSRAA